MDEKNRIKKLIFVYPDFPSFEIWVILKSGEKEIKIEIHKKERSAK